MKRLFILLCIATLTTGCASLMALQTSRAELQEESTLPARFHVGETIPFATPSYPSVAVTSDGRHALVMPPCGNTAVVVNPDGSHSIAIINGSTATIVTP